MTSASLDRQSPIYAPTKTPNNLWRIEDGALRLSLHPGQAQAWRSKARFVAVIAGTQSGKTSFLPWLLWREIETRGGGDYLAVTSSYDLLKLKFLPSLRECFEHVLRRGRYWAGDRVIEIAEPGGKFLAKVATDPMWARIILRSASAGSGLESATAKAAILDEAGQDEFTVEDWEAVLRRLSLSQGRAFIGTTPYNLGWLKTAIYDRWVAGDPNFEVVQFASTMNPIFPRAEYERAKETMPAWRFQLMYQGLFSRPAGLIYDCFNPTFHAVEPFPIPPTWPRYVGQDYGGVNTAHVWAAHDREAQRYYVYDESLEGGLSTAEHAAKAKVKADRKVLGWWGGAGSEEQQRMDYQAAGIPVKEPPIKDVEGGISRVYGLFKEDRLFVFRSCAGLLDELGSYRRKLDATGQPTEVIENKRTYHRIDALRYLCVGLVGNPVDPLLGMIIGKAVKGW